MNDESRAIENAEARATSPLQGKLNMQELIIDELMSSIAKLTEQLQPVTLNEPIDEVSKTDAEVVASPIVRQVVANNECIHQAIYRLERLRDRLEV